MGAVKDARIRTLSPQRCALWGFVLGVAITVPATFFALLFNAGETLHPYLVPGAELLDPLSDVMAPWPGLLIMVMTAAVNGVIYAVSAGALGTLLTLMSRR